MAEMFEVGDAVIHPVSGAGVVASLRKMPGFSKSRQCYKINMLGRTKTTIMVPIEKAADLGLRPAIEAEDLDRVWDVLGAEPEPLPKAHKKRYKLCNDKIATGEILKIAEVVRDLAWRKVEEERLNVPGRRIYRKARRLLSGEIAVSQDIDMVTAEEQIDQVLEENFATEAVVS